MTMRMKMRMAMGMRVGAGPRLLAAVVASGMLLAPGTVLGQMPVIVGEQMPDFTLPSIQGGSVTLSGLTGKNVLLIFPRGRVGDHWCQICHYQYAELVELEKKLNLRDKYEKHAYAIVNAYEKIAFKDNVSPQHKLEALKRLESLNPFLQTMRKKDADDEEDDRLAKRVEEWLTEDE